MVCTPQEYHDNHQYIRINKKRRCIWIWKLQLEVQSLTIPGLEFDKYLTSVRKGTDRVQVFDAVLFNMRLGCLLPKNACSKSRTTTPMRLVCYLDLSNEVLINVGPVGSCASMQMYGANWDKSVKIWTNEGYFMLIRFRSEAIFAKYVYRLNFNKIQDGGLIT